MGNCFASSANLTATDQLSSGIGRSQTTSDSTISSSGNSLFSLGSKSDGSFNEGQILPSSNLRIFSFLELKSATKNFRAEGLLGEGGFGGVYKGWINGTVVAVKKLNAESSQGFEEWELKAFLSYTRQSKSYIETSNPRIYCWMRYKDNIIFCQEGHLYVKSDVYGFGVVLVEILTGLRALDPNRPSEQFSLVNWVTPHLSDRRTIRKVMDPRLEGKYPSDAAVQTAHLALKCLVLEPKCRPSMKEVIKILEEIETADEKPNHRPRNPRINHKQQSSPLRPR
ncbi:hypothetical protein QQ045_029103 [Rhodiola kirilowii]